MVGRPVAGSGQNGHPGGDPLIAVADGHADPLGPEIDPQHPAAGNH